MVACFDAVACAQFHITTAVRAVLLADTHLRVAGMAEAGSCTPMAEEAFGGRLLAVAIAIFAFAAGIVSGCILKG